MEDVRREVLGSAFRVHFHRLRPDGAARDSDGVAHKTLHAVRADDNLRIKRSLRRFQHNAASKTLQRERARPVHYLYTSFSRSVCKFGVELKPPHDPPDARLALYALAGSAFPRDAVDCHGGDVNPHPDRFKNFVRTGADCARAELFPRIYVLFKDDNLVRQRGVHVRQKQGGCNARRAAADNRDIVIVFQ